MGGVFRSNEANKKGRWWRWVHGVVILAVVVGLWLVRDVFEEAWAHSSEFEAAKREGAIVTAEDLRKLCAVKDEDNAAPILRPLLPKAPTYDSGPAIAINNYISTQTTSVTPGTHKEPIPSIEEALKQLDATVGDLSALLSKPGCDFDKRWEDGANLAFAEFGPMKSLAKIECARAKWQAEHGKQLEAVKHFRIAFKLGKFAADSPTLIGALVRIAFDAITFNSIQGVAKSLPNDADLRKELRGLLEEWSDPGTMTKPMLGELFFNWHTAQHLNEYSSAVQDPDFGENGLGFPSRFPIVRTAWKTRSLRFCRSMRRTLDQTHGDPAAFFGASAAPENVEPDSRKVSTMLDAMLIPVFSNAGKSFMKRTASYEVCFAVLELLDERQRLGHWPAKLPVQRRDPFGGQPLKYEVVGDHAKIWSIGMDFTDSHGKSKKEDQESDDIVAEL